MLMSKTSSQILFESRHATSGEDGRLVAAAGCHTSPWCRSLEIYSIA